MQEQKELNKDFTTMVKAIELAQEKGGVYKLQDAAVLMVAMENLSKFIQKANGLIEKEEQEILKREMVKAEEIPVEKPPLKKVAAKSKK